MARRVRERKSEVRGARTVHALPSERVGQTAAGVLPPPPPPPTPFSSRAPVVSPTRFDVTDRRQPAVQHVSTPPPAPSCQTCTALPVRSRTVLPCAPRRGLFWYSSALHIVGGGGGGSYFRLAAKIKNGKAKKPGRLGSMTDLRTRAGNGNVTSIRTKSTKEENTCQPLVSTFGR